MSFKESAFLYFKWSSQFNNVAATLLNTVLAPILLFKNSSSIGGYKYLLLGIVIAELVYSISAILTEQHLRTNARGWILYAASNLLPYEMGFVFLTANATAAALTSTILACSFLYRYVVLCRTDLLPWFTQPLRVGIIVLFNIFIGISSAAQVAFMFHPTEELTEVLMTSDKERNINLTELAYMAIIVNDENGSYTMEAMMCISSWTWMFLSCSSVYVFTTIKILKEFENTAAVNFSATALRAHKQLFKLLTLQTLSPALLLHVPVVFSYLFAVRKFESGFFLDVCSYLPTFVSFIDPLLILYFIKKYRDAFLDFITKPLIMFFSLLKLKSKEQTVTTTTSVVTTIQS